MKPIFAKSKVAFDIREVFWRRRIKGLRALSARL
jgi:hypothetical protein